MPYVRCADCGLAAYTAAGYTGRDHCPRCGEELPDAVGAGSGGWRTAPSGRAPFPTLMRDPEEVRPQLSPVDEPTPLALALALAHEQLDMDVALLTEVVGGRQIIRQMAGDSGWLGIAPGDSFPLEDTYCQRQLDGRIQSIVADARHDERVADLETAGAVGIGAYIGVALRVEDIRLYMLCCIAREARPALGEADVRFLVGLGETVTAELGAAA